MTAKRLASAAIILAIASCASPRKDPYDTGNIYGFPDAAYPDDQGGSLYDVPPAYEDAAPAPDLSPASPASTTHTVARGETLSKISRKYNVSMQAIADANGIRNKNLLVVGQKLTIPGR